jgi:hypothetical protein
MRSTLILAVLMSAVAFPAAAEVTEEQLAAAHELYDNTEISDDSAVALYCGAAYTLVANQATADGKTDDATQAKTMADALLAKAEAGLIAEGMADADRSKLAEAYTYVANAGVMLGTEEPKYTQDECVAAAGK